MRTRPTRTPSHPLGRRLGVLVCVLSTGLLGGCPAFGYGDVGGSGSIDLPGGRTGGRGRDLSGGDGGGGLHGSAGDLDGAADANADGNAVDAAHDGAVDANTDGGLEGAVDGATDAMVDATADAMADGATDAMADAATDAMVDGGDGSAACPSSCDAGSVCQDGSCAPVVCASGFGECDGRGDLVCETEFATDPLHCGNCETICPANGGTAICDGGACDTRCDLNGTFALKLTAPSSWARQGQVGSDSGTFEFWLRVRATHDSNEAALEVLECGQTVPVVTAWLVNEDTLFYYPDSLYDAEVLSSVPATMTLGDSSPDSSLSLPVVTMQLGVDLADPLNDPWPSTAAGLADAVRVDAEGDGNPGVTALYSNTGNYVYPRTSASLLPKRAAEAYVGVRWSFSLSGALTDCDNSQGDAVVGSPQTRVLGCRHANDSLCSTSEANHLDTNLPDFQMGAATYALSRVADDASCAAVRAALP